MPDAEIPAMVPAVRAQHRPQDPCSPSPAGLVVGSDLAIPVGHPSGDRSAGLLVV